MCSLHKRKRNNNNKKTKSKSSGSMILLPQKQKKKRETQTQESWYFGEHYTECHSYFFATFLVPENIWRASKHKERSETSIVGSRQTINGCNNLLSFSINVKQQILRISLRIENSQTETLIDFHEYKYFLKKYLIQTTIRNNIKYSAKNSYFEII